MAPIMLSSSRRANDDARPVEAAVTFSGTFFPAGYGSRCDAANQPGTAGEVRLDASGGGGHHDQPGI
ncbi:MAG TPA: hypothetical protein DHU96_16335 [Actinobacteria bacterium]|nr:hypothetical protein [Actinomycetota bacterium]